MGAKGRKRLGRKINVRLTTCDGRGIFGSGNSKKRRMQCNTMNIDWQTEAWGRQASSFFLFFLSSFYKGK
jgi:glutamine amidotransferase PdxT